MGTLRTTNIQHADASAAGMILAADGTVSGLRATQNTQSGTTYSLASTDSGRTVTLSNAAAVTVNLPAQATVAWNVGETLSLLNLGVGTVTVVPAATVTINGTPLTLATSKGGSLVRTASNTWTFTPTGGGGPTNGSDAIATSQSKSGGAYGDLATPGPIVTIVTGTRALVTVTSFMTNSIASGYMDVGVSVSGATTRAAVGMLGTRNPGTTAFQFLGSGSIMFTGLTAGTNVFRMEYSAGTGTATFLNRFMTVIDMGS